MKQGGWMQSNNKLPIDGSVLSSLDQPFNGLGSGLLHGNPLNVSGRMIIKDPSQERYGGTLH